MEFSIMPASRVSQRFRPELKVYAPAGGQLDWTIRQEGAVKHQQSFQLPAGPDYTRLFLEPPGSLTGQCLFSFTASDEAGVLSRDLPYEILDASVASTTLLDGAWVSLICWSESEGRQFNDALRQVTDGQWEETVVDMHRLGIDSIIVQNVFHNDEYVFCHQQGLDHYLGQALYPSELYPARYEMAAADPMEHILRQADELAMQVFVGVGLYAWFDFSADSLAWHKKVVSELWQRYGHHPSFYAFYLSQEMHGDFYDQWPEHSDRWVEVADFCRDFAAFIKHLAPTKPIALAPNNIRFQQSRTRWLAVLENIDILLPFAFARDLEHLNVAEIQDICREAGTHLWIDLEVFKFPFEDTGLIPKSGDELTDEIRIYDAVENIFGYQYTGLLNNPDRSFRLGGEDTVSLFRQYEAYARRVRAERGRGLQGRDGVAG